MIIYFTLEDNVQLWPMEYYDKKLKDSSTGNCQVI